VFKSSWPSFDESFIKEDEVSYVIQVNGKVRSKVNAGVEATEEEVKALALSDSKTKEWLKGVSVKKIIVVPGKLVSIVAA